jgi:hypothetical protein
MAGQSIDTLYKYVGEQGANLYHYLDSKKFRVWKRPCSALPIIARYSVPSYLMTSSLTPDFLALLGCSR